MVQPTREMANQPAKTYFLFINCEHFSDFINNQALISGIFRSYQRGLLIISLFFSIFAPV